MYDEINESVNNEQVADVQDVEIEVNEVEVDEVENNESTNNTMENQSEEKVEVADQPEDDSRNYEHDRIAAQARREAEARLKAEQSKQETLAKSLGFQSFDELLESQAKQKYIDEGYDEPMATKMYEMDQMMSKFKTQERKIAIQEQKEKIKDWSFFKELEPELDILLERSPDTPVETAFKYIRGEKIDELMEKHKSVSKQKTINDLNNKNHIKGEMGGVEIDTIHIDEDEWKMYKALNHKASKKEWIEFKKNYG